MTKKQTLKAPDRKADFIAMSLRLDPKLHERIRRLSFDSKESMHSIALRGLEMALKAAKY